MAAASSVEGSPRQETPAVSREDTLARLSNLSSELLDVLDTYASVPFETCTPELTTEFTAELKALYARASTLLAVVIPFSKEEDFVPVL